MAAITTIGALWDRLIAVVIAQGFAKARTPFDFDRQPDGTLDQAFCLSSVRDSTQGYLGGDQAEQHTVTIYVARRIKRDDWGAVRQLKADLDAIEAVVCTDYANYDYVVVDDGVTNDVKEPSASEDYVVGRLRLKVDFDRMM